ncbi:MAG: hypothetical protein WCF12_06570, partial [Propionicimonas sp.]
AKHGNRDQWEIRIAADGIPEAIPPARIDPQRQPIRHTRFTKAGPPQDGTTPPGTAPPGTAPPAA